MKSFKTILLAGVSALLCAAGFAAPASATPVNGGGSSLIAPYVSQIFLCHTGSDTARALYYGSNGATKTITACPQSDSSADSSNSFAYLTSGSGAAQRGVFSQTAGNLESTAGAFTAPFSTVAFGLSDAALTAANVDVYNNGTPTGSSFQGITIQGSNNGNTGTYANPYAARGALIQIPMAIDPVALGYNAEYGYADGSHYSFAHQITLTKSDTCKIFNGVHTNWNAVDSSLKNSADTTHSFSDASIHLVGRSDNSGTTSIFTHFLTAVCASEATNYYTAANLNGSSYQQLPTAVQSLFNRQSGSGGVATAVGTTYGSIGYIGADYVSPANSNTNATTQNLLAAAVQNGASYYNPTAANAVAAFGTVSAPTDSDEADQTKWTPDVSNPSTGYPIIGTTNFLLYTQYDADTVAALTGDGSSGPVGFLRWYYTNSNPVVSTVLGNAALGALPNSWNEAITAAFVTGDDRQGLAITTTP